MNPGLSWTADGKALIVVDACKPACRLAQVNVQSGETQVVTDPPPNSDGDDSPAVSPDGKRLVYRRQMGTDAKRWERIPLPVDGKSTAEVLTEAGPVSSPASIAWMPNGRALILAGGEGGQMMHRLDLETMRSQPVSGTDSGVRPSISRDGKLVFLRLVVDRNVWRLKVGSHGRMERLIASDRQDLHAVYSPDGKRVAFLSDRGGTQQVWVADSDGTNAVSLTTDAVMPAAPRWSPDGKWVAFAARPGGNVDIYATPASGGAVKRLTQHPGEDASARYSRDGRWIYFASNRTGRREVWRKAADGTGEEMRITRNGGWVSRESKDGQWLYYTKFGMGPGVFRMKLPAGEEEKVIEADPESAWALENDALYFADAGFDGYRKWDPATRKVSVAVKTGFRPFRGPGGLSVSPDGEWLLIWKVDANISEILMLEGVR